MNGRCVIKVLTKLTDILVHNGAAHHLEEVGVKFLWPFQDTVKSRAVDGLVSSTPKDVQTVYDTYVL
mgnify:CR=1 FL=1